MNPERNPHALLKVGTAAKVMKLTRQGVHFLVRHGGLEAERTLEGQVLIRLGVLRDFIDARVNTRLHAVGRPRMIRIDSPEPRQLVLPLVMNGPKFWRAARRNLAHLAIKPQMAKVPLDDRQAQVVDVRRKLQHVG
jgi:hypothetical protein